MDNIDFVSNYRALKGDPSIVTIGAFDGVHLGHQQLLRQLSDTAQSRQLPSVVIVFEPQPNEYFNRERAPARLMRLREKVASFASYGVDRVLCLKFDRRLSSLSPKAFVEEVLVRHLGVQKLIVGDDFRFGSDRSGDFELLSRLGQKFGYEVVDTQTLRFGEIRISSTYIRELLNQAKLDEAAELIGRRYDNLGRVIFGRQLGRKIGFPTMNLQLGRVQVPLHGVFAAEVEIKGRIYQGVVNVGVRPTVNAVLKPLLEVHVLDADLDVYGEFIRVIYRKKIRDEKRFNNVADLTQQISLDVEQARRYFSGNIQL